MESQGPKVEGWVRKKPVKESCLDPGKKEYEVVELESALHCKDRNLEKLEKRFDTLNKATEQVKQGG